MNDHPGPFAIRSAIERANFVRTSNWLGSASGRFKEWFHFSVNGQNKDAIVNFNLFDDPTSEPAGRIGRVIALVRDGSWRGGIHEVDGQEARALPGGQGVALGNSTLRFHRGSYLMHAEVPALEMTLDLTFAPLTVPAQANNTHLPPDGTLHWLLVPRLSANGTVRYGGRVVEFREAPSYHDHNWGDFSWGGDFAWEWGYVAPGGTVPFSLVMTRLSNRGHTRDYDRSIMVWKEGRQVRLFRDVEVVVAHTGCFRPPRLLRVPGVLGLVSPGTASEMPAHVEVQARSGADHLRLWFEPKDAVQIGVPNDGDVGMTLINEVWGHARVAGQIRGDAVSFEASSVFEFLNG
jgi:hypothetical protein